MGCVFFLLAPFVTWAVPDTVDDLEEESLDDISHGGQELGYEELISNRRVLFLLLGIGLVTTVLCFLDPILAPFLNEAYGV